MSISLEKKLINIYVVAFKVTPFRYNTLVSILEALLISTFWYSLISSSDDVFISSIVANLRPIKCIFSFGYSKKSQAAKYGEYGVVIGQILRPSNDL